MTETVYGLTADDGKLLGDIGRKHRQRLPDVGRRTRRVPPTTSAPKLVEIQSTVGPGKVGIGRVQKITNDPATLASGDVITLADTDPVQDIKVVNFRPNYLGAGIVYIAHRMGHFWVIENDACFQDFMA